MRYIIDEETGSAYARGSDDPRDELYNEVFYAPLSSSGKYFDTDDGTIVDIWESAETEYRIKTLLGIICKCPTCNK